MKSPAMEQRRAERVAAAQPPPDLAQPEPLVERLSLCVVEILIGARQPETLARWLDEDTYLQLLERTLSARRMRDALGRKPPTSIGIGIHSLRCTRIGSAIEAVTVVSTPTRGRAVAMRLEPRGSRWRATSLVVL